MTSQPPPVTPPTSAGVHFPPPMLFASGFLVGWLLQRVYDLPILPPSNLAREPLGLALLVLGFAGTAWGMITFVRARTAVIPNRPASRLVTSGPYRFSRNPMYIGLSMGYVGLTLLVNSAWPLLILPLVIIALLALVIQREERYLQSAFGDEYAEYTRRVRRWL